MTSEMTYELREVTSSGRSLDDKLSPASTKRNKTTGNELVLSPNAALHVCKIHTLCSSSLT